MDPQSKPPSAPLPPGIETVIVPRAHDIGGFEVRRALPARVPLHWLVAGELRPVLF